MRKKLITAIIALSLVLTSLVGITVAWLYVKTDDVVNTFAPSNIELTLEETGTTNGKKEYQMIPGEELAKDPKVTVTADIACYVFVKIEASDNFANYLTYTVADGWIPLIDEDSDKISDNGVYYQTVDAKATFKDVSVLAGDKVVVKNSVTKTMMDELEKDSTKNPTLTFTAYAVQQAGMTSMQDAWAAAQGQKPTT